MPNGFSIPAAYLGLPSGMAGYLSETIGPPLTVPSIEIPSMPQQLQAPVITPPKTGPIETLANILWQAPGAAVEVAGGALETAGGIGKGILDTLWDAGKFILENLDVGIEATTDILSQDWAKRLAGIGGGRTEAEKLKAQELALTAEALQLQREQLAAKQTPAVPAVTPAEEGIIGQLSDVLFGKPAAYAVPETVPAQAGPNYIVLIGLAIAAYFLLRK